MGWTKHRDAIDVYRKIRSNSLASLKRLANQVRKDFKAGQLDFKLVREFHAQLQSVSELDVALGAYGSELNPYFDTLLKVTSEWVIGNRNDD